MTSSFQAASLVASPSYPNAVAWSDENLVAVASGHLVTILNPAMPFGPRGLITIPPSKPFPIGVVEREDLLSGCLLSACLSRDLRPCVRSISWSPVGFAPHAGSLLAVCTIEGHVKLYRMPYCEFSAEWIEVFDISDMMYKYFSSIEFGESDTHNAEHSSEQANQLSLEHGCTAKQSSSVSKMERKRRRENSLALINKDTVNSRSCKDSYPSSIPCPGKLITASKEVALFPCSLLQEGSPVEVLRLDGQQRIWIAGTLKCFSGGKALVLFPEVNGQEKPSEWVEMQPHHYNSDGRNLLTDTVANQENGIPSIRPSINVGRLPKQIPLRDCHGVEEILKIGDMVETWTNDRWIEGTFMGFNDSGLLVKLHGDMGSVSLDASFVRLAPVWINEQNSWKVTIVRIEIKDQELHKVVGVKSHNMEANNPNQVVPVCHSKAKPRKKIPEVSGLPLISADQYASRSTMLSSLIVAWSPVVQLVSELGPVDMNDSATCCSILAVGGKSGKISFWKVPEPQCFSVMSHGDSTSAFLVGLLQAHSGWITAIGWALCSSGASDPLLLLATGSSDGSVKIWLGNSGQLLKSSEVNHAPFSLLKEVETPDSVAISVVSLIVPIKSPDKLHLAVGKGSGTLDVFICDIATTSGKVDKVVSDGAHNHVDNSIRSWILRDNFLFEVPISPNTPAVKSSSDVCNVFDSCFGLAASPGNLMVAVVRSFDVDFLNPMYQARAQKAAVEFFWIGGQQLDRLPNEDSNFDVEKFSGFSEKELIYWTHNILWSLNQYEQVDKPLVIWDIITALLAFKQSTPEYVDHVLAKWLIPWVGTQLGPSVAKTLSHAPRFLSNMSVRQLHLMNILSRRVVLAELTAEKISYNEKNLEELSDAKEEYITSWLDLLQNSEREIRERLVAFSFSTVSSLISNSSTKFSPRCWHPVGLAQMEQWIALDRNHIQDHLKLLAGEVRKFKKSKIQSICNYVEEEQCSYCSAPVPFESTEVAFCQGADCGDGVCRSHKLFRCTASMQVCPTTPSWFCLCCQRWTSNLAPLALFRMVTYPSDIRFSTQYFKLDLLSKPLCPFCGVLLQRLQPEFILSTSPV